MPLPESPFLQAGFRPLRQEFDDLDLAIEGELPPDLEGLFLRIGPNPQFPPRGAYNPLNGDGMIHGFRIGGGRVVYRNRWVRTARWAYENAAGRALFGTSGDPADRDPSVIGVPLDGSANTNLVWHAGRLLALEEGHGPIEIDPDSLETLGRWTFDGALPRNMTAHPKVDPATGEMAFIANFPTGRLGRELAFHVAGADGRIVRSAMIEGPFPCLVHDFALAGDFVAVAFCPATVSLSRIQTGGPPVAWEPELGTHIAVFRRAAPAEVRWWTAPACMVWHLLNGFNNLDTITLDVCAQDTAMFPLADGTPPDEAAAGQRLVRWTLDWERPGALMAETLWDGPCEYPGLDERLLGRRHRYGYFACDGGPGTGDLFHRGLARFDFETREIDRWTAGSGRAVGEPVFVPRHADSGEGDGHILTTVYDEASDRSCLAVFRADALSAGPVARAYLQHRVPMGFHALWLASSARS